MTTVGYGDPVSSPDLGEFMVDYWVLTITMIASVFGFYLC